MKGLFRSKLFLSLTALVMVLLLTVTISQATRARAANNSEQVVFSGTGSGTFGGTPTPFGFWIWCEASSTNPYQGECNGSMYFYALHITKHVEDVQPIQEVTEGQYLMTVQSRDGTVKCTLENSLPLKKGPNNTVTATCTVPSGSGTSNSAVVNVTGP